MPAEESPPERSGAAPDTGEPTEEDWADDHPTRHPPPPDDASPLPTLTAPPPPGYTPSESGPPSALVVGEVSPDDPDIAAALASEVDEDEILVDDTELVADASGTEYTRPASSLSADDFANAGGTTASKPPPNPGTNTGSAVLILIRLDDEFGIRFPQDTEVAQAKALKALLVDKTWPEPEADRVELIKLILKTVDPSAYRSGEPWEQGSYPILLDVFFAELGRHPKFAKILNALRAKAPRKIPTPRHRHR